MLNKLIRFEFRSCFRMLLIIWAALIAMTIILSIVLSVGRLNGFQQLIQSGQVLSMISGILNVISWIVYVALFVALVVLTIAVVITRFYQGLLGDEGYLMHTLPVKEWQLITAKGITAACAVIGSSIVGIISVTLLCSAGNLGEIPKAVGEIGRDIAQEPLLAVVFFEFFIISVLSLLKSIYQIYAAIAIGQLASRHRILASLGAYIGILIILSALGGMLLTIGFVSGIGENIGAWLDRYSIIMDGNELQGFGPSQVILLLLFLGTAVQLAAFHVVTERILTKRLNLL